MPRYFFHLRDQYELHEDEEGIDLPDVQAVLEEALRTDRELDREPAGIYGLELEIADSEVARCSRCRCKSDAAGGHQPLASFVRMSTAGQPTCRRSYTKREQPAQGHQLTYCRILARVMGAVEPVHLIQDAPLIAWSPQAP
jgi:hypothetical protein